MAKESVINIGHENQKSRAGKRSKISKSWFKESIANDITHSSDSFLKKKLGTLK